MIRLDAEELLTFNEAAKYLPDRRRRSAATWWRWRVRGIRGICLETVLVGGRRFTTKEALERFIEALSKPPSQEFSRRKRPTNTRAKEIAAAEQELAQDGI